MSDTATPNQATDLTSKTKDAANIAKEKAMEKANAAKDMAKEKLQVLGKDLYLMLKNLIKEGTARNIIVKNAKGEKVFAVSSIIGTAAALFLGWAIAPLAVAAGWMMKYTIEFDTTKATEPAQNSPKQNIENGETGDEGTD